MQCPDAAAVATALRDYKKLVDRFYRKNEHLMAPAQYKAALEDLEYFAALIELEEHYYGHNNLQGGGK
jgi:hypothetical protein